MLSRFRNCNLHSLVSTSLGVIALSSLGLAGCGGVTTFAGSSAFAIAATPPPAPAPVVAKPEPKPAPRVELRDNKIEFKEKIQFEANKAVIKPASDALLHDIAEVIKKNPQVKKLSIEGHASAEGDAKRNKTLSEQRAKAVLEHLVKKEGVDGARLASRGWGSEKGIAPNDSEDNREKNRRVEFLVAEADVTVKKVEIDPTSGKESIVETKTEALKLVDTPAPASNAAKPVESSSKAAPAAKAGEPAKAAAAPKAAAAKPSAPATAKPATPAQEKK